MLLPVNNLKGLSPDIIQVVDRMVVQVPDTKGSAIVEFFAGKTVFITGGTGFLGKVLIEKLLRVCNGIKRIYLLCRKKKDKDGDERLREMLDTALYEKLRALQPNFMDKIVSINGDIGLPGMGISDEHRKILIQEVNIIFHVAANVNFNDCLKNAATLNVKAVIEMLTLGRECTNLQSYVHVSTAYSNPNSADPIAEKFYVPPMTPDNLMELIATKSAEEIEMLEPSLMGAYPNSYTFTKNIAEDAVRKYGANLPICITRPSIVISSYEDPIRGYVDNLNGPTGLVLAATLGFVRTMFLDGDSIPNYVPVDYAINNTIVAAHRNYVDKPSVIPKIYNYVSEPEHSLSHEIFAHKMASYGPLTPSKMGIWYPFLYVTRSTYAYKVLAFFMNYLPALLLDIINGFTHFTGKKDIQFVRINNQYEKMVSRIAVFLTQKWIWRNDNVRTMWKELPEVDKRLFPFDILTVDWDFYMKMYTVGIRSYVLKEDILTVPEARRKYIKLFAAHCLLVGFLALTSLWLVTKFYGLLFN